MGITKFTLVDSPERMRPQNTSYSIVFPQLKTSLPHKDHNQDEIQTKSAVIKRGSHLISSLNSGRLCAVLFLCRVITLIR